MMRARRFLRGDVAPILCKLALLFFGVLGQTAQGNAEDFMSASRWLFYTNLSNLAVMAAVVALLPYDVMRLVRRGGAPAVPDYMQAVRFTVTVGIALTFVVFSLLLTPEMLMKGHGDYLTSLSNLCVHNLVPLLAILDFCLFAWPWKTGKRTFLLGAILPLSYVAFVYVGGALGVTFGKGRRVPYFFFDYQKNGWFALGNGRFGTAYWLILLGVAVLAMAFGLLAAKDAVARKRAAPQR